MSDSYLIPATELVFEEEIKHSRFITLLFACDSADSFRQQMILARQTYPGATHYCYAYVLGRPTDSINIGSSDDGEPSGSAGRPMLATLQGANIGEIGAIVIRYYGGTKLGVGGLVRAYTSGMKQGLTQLVTQLKQIRYPAKLDCDYAQLRDIEYLLQKFDAVIEDKQFAENISITFSLAKAAQIEFNLELATMTHGLVQAEFDIA